MQFHRQKFIFSKIPYTKNKIQPARTHKNKLLSQPAKTHKNKRKSQLAQQHPQSSKPRSILNNIPTTKPFLTCQSHKRKTRLHLAT